MDLFCSLMKTDPGYVISAWHASHNGNSEMFREFIEYSIDIISPYELKMIIIELISHEDLFHWFINKYPDIANEQYLIINNPHFLLFFIFVIGL